MLAVVGYHLWPARLTGGFVGVDVFFVISGFLITAHLQREVDSTGTVSLPRFWARRVRRLLPASLVVLAASVVGVGAFVPAIFRQQFFVEIGAASAYFLNWLLAGNAVDYLAADNVASPAQHYWSLSTEEQFYLAWPLLIVLAVLVSGAAASAVRRRTAITVVLAVVTVASFAFSVVFTSIDPSAAYFVTPTRAWEFGAGGLLALFLPTAALGRSVGRTVLAWCGWLGIAATILLFSEALPFPGWIALLPVASTLAVIAAATPANRWSPTAIVNLAPVRWVGDISYSLYLWHWPLIVLAPFALDRDLGWRTKLLLLVAAIVLAWLTKILVEDPVRSRGPLPRSRPALTFAAMAAGTLVVLSGTGIGWTAVQARVDSANASIATAETAAGPCLGAGAIAAGPITCAEAEFDSRVLPDPIGIELPDHCLTQLFESTVKPCVHPVPKGTTARGAVAVIGDSHADAFGPAVFPLAAERGWTVYQLGKASCPFTTSHRDDGASRPRAETARMNSSCDDWNAGVVAFLEDHRDIHTVFVSASSRNRFASREGAGSFDSAAAGYVEAWSRVPESVSRIIVLRDVPRPRVDIPVCVDENRDSPNSSCSTTPDAAILPDPQQRAVTASGDPRVHLVDLNSSICTTTVCPAVVGEVLTFRDTHHMVPLFARSLSPMLALAVDRLDSSR